MEETHGRAGGCTYRLWPHGKLALEQVWGCRERGSHAGAGLLAGLVILWGTDTGAACSWRSAPCGRRLCCCSSGRTAAHGKNPVAEFNGGLSPMGGTPYWSMGSVWGFSPWGGRSNRVNVWWTKRSPHSLLEGEGRESGVKLSWGRTERWEGSVVRFGFISHCHTLIWLVTDSVTFPMLPVREIAASPPCPYLDP